jgi:hypothetical protein
MNKLLLVTTSVVSHVIVYNRSLTVAAHNQHFRAPRVSKRYLGQDTSPLIAATVDAKDDSGNFAHWQCETGAPNELMRRQPASA